MTLRSSALCIRRQRPACSPHGSGDTGTIKIDRETEDGRRSGRERTPAGSPRSSESRHRGRYRARPLSRHGDRRGATWADRPAGSDRPRYSGQRHPLTLDSVFSIFSVTKALTNVLVVPGDRAGQFALTTRVSEIIPEFAGGPPRADHLLSSPDPQRRAAQPSMRPSPACISTGWTRIIAAICEGRALRRRAGRADRLFADDQPRADGRGGAPDRSGQAVLSPDRRGRDLHAAQDGPAPRSACAATCGNGRSSRISAAIRRSTISAHSNLGPNGAFEEEEAEMPWVGCAATVPDMFRFAEMLRRNGELDGARILSPAILEKSRINQTGEKAERALQGARPPAAAGSRSRPISGSVSRCADPASAIISTAR